MRLGFAGRPPENQRMRRSLLLLVALAGCSRSAPPVDAPKDAAAAEGADITFTSSPPGAAAIASGEHELLIALPGHVPVRKHLGAKDRGPVTLKLLPAASLTVRSTPPGARIFVDGADTGQVTPAADVPVAAGAVHQL